MNCIRRNFDDFNLGTTLFPTLKEVFPETYINYLEVQFVLSYNKKGLEECKFVLPRYEDKDHVYIPKIDRLCCVYINKSTGKQRVSDNLIEDVSCMLECSHESLYITAAKTGQVLMIYGLIKLITMK
ncbi:hypothetical protein ACFX13_045601 [Malus domestica]